MGTIVSKLFLDFWIFLYLQGPLDKHCNPHQLPVGVGLHAQPGLSGHLTRTSIIYTLCTTK